MLGHIAHSIGVLPSGLKLFPENSDSLAIGEPLQLMFTTGLIKLGLKNGFVKSIEDFSMNETEIINFYYWLANCVLR